MPLSRILAFALLLAALTVSALSAQPKQTASMGDAQVPVTAVQPIDARLAEARKNLALTEPLA